MFMNYKLTYVYKVAETGLYSMAKSGHFLFFDHSFLILLEIGVFKVWMMSSSCSTIKPLTLVGYLIPFLVFYDSVKNYHFTTK